MTKQQIQALIDAKIAGQGSAVDVGGALPTILHEILEAAFAGANVQSNWDETDSDSPQFIQNKPTIPAAQVNADWNATEGVAEILNKPTIPAAQVQSDWNQTDSDAVDFIKNKPTIPETLIVEGTITHQGPPDSKIYGFTPDDGQPSKNDAINAFLAGKRIVIKYPYSGDGETAYKWAVPIMYFTGLHSGSTFEFMQLRNDGDTYDYINWS